MRELTFIVPPEYDGVRANSFLRTFCGISYRMMVKLKRTEGGITSNGELLRTIDKVKSGSKVRLCIHECGEPAEPRNIYVPILFEDEDLLICDKPPDMPVHPSRGHADDTLANAVAAHLMKNGEYLPFRPINRLDRDTSGLVLCAKNGHIASMLAKGCDKTYYAVCQGEIIESGTIDLPIRIKEGHGIQREVGEGGVTAITNYRAIKCDGRHTFLEINLETGRTHQIRVHFSHIGYPLAGDDMYGGSREFINRQALHCSKMSFKHPITKEIIAIESPVPEDIEGILSGGLQKNEK